MGRRFFGALLGATGRPWASKAAGAAGGAEAPDETGNTAPQLSTKITEVKVPDLDQ